MIATRLAKAETGDGGRKWAGRGRDDTHAVVFRTGATGASGTTGVKTAGGKQTRDGEGSGLSLQGIGPIFGPETEFIEERFYEMNNQLGRLSNFEERLGKLVNNANRLMSSIKTVITIQKEVIK